MKNISCYSLLVLFLVSCVSSNQVQTPKATSTNSNDLGKEVMNLKVTIIVTDNAARSLHGLAEETDESLQLLQTVEGLGLTLEPLHPGIDDPTLLPYFTIEVPDTETAERVISKLQQLPAVEGAYTKPPDELP